MGGKMNNEPVGTVIETEEIYGHTFKKRKSKIVKWLKKVDVGTLLYVNPSKEDEGKVCARCGAIAYDPVITQIVKEQGNPVAWRSQDPDGYWSVYQAPVEGAEPLYTGFKEIKDEEIIESLAELEHEQWMKWAETIMQTEKISDARFARWASFMITYADLTEEMKEFDREWARKALAILRKAQEK